MFAESTLCLSQPEKKVCVDIIDSSFCCFIFLLIKSRTARALWFTLLKTFCFLFHVWPANQRLMGTLCKITPIENGMSSETYHRIDGRNQFRIFGSVLLELVALQRAHSSRPREPITFQWGLPYYIKRRLQWNETMTWSNWWAIDGIGSDSERRKTLDGTPSSTKISGLNVQKLLCESAQVHKQTNKQQEKEFSFTRIKEMTTENFSSVRQVHSFVRVVQR